MSAPSGALSAAGFLVRQGTTNLDSGGAGGPPLICKRLLGPAGASFFRRRDRDRGLRSSKACRSASGRGLVLVAFSSVETPWYQHSHSAANDSGEPSAGVRQQGCMPRLVCGHSNQPSAGIRQRRIPHAVEVANLFRGGNCWVKRPQIVAFSGLIESPSPGQAVLMV